MALAATLVPKFLSNGDGAPPWEEDRKHFIRINLEKMTSHYENEDLQMEVGWMWWNRSCVPPAACGRGCSSCSQTLLGPPQSKADRWSRWWSSRCCSRFWNTNISIQTSSALLPVKLLSDQKTNLKPLFIKNNIWNLTSAPGLSGCSSSSSPSDAPRWPENTVKSHIKPERSATRGAPAFISSVQW